MVTDKLYSTPVTTTTSTAITTTTTSTAITTSTTATVTPASRWTLKSGNDDMERKKSAWTEVRRKQQDPFAGMNSRVDYEQEIERLKQITPKVDSVKRRNPKQQSNKCMEKKNRNTGDHEKSSELMISRSNSPDTAHSSDLDSLSSEHSGITEEEKIRFLTFVRNWTGDWKGAWGDHHDEGALEFNSHSNDYSLWADQSPWNTSLDHRRHQQQYLTSAHLRYTHPANNDYLMTSNPPSVVHPESADLYWQWKQKCPDYSSSLYHHPPSTQKYPKNPIGMGRNNTAHGRSASFGVFAI